MNARRRQQRVSNEARSPDFADARNAPLIGFLKKAMRRRSRSYPLDELSFQLHQRGNGLRAGPRVTLKMMPTDRCPLKQRRPRPLLRFWGRRAMFRLRVELALSLTHPRSRHKLSLFAPS